MALYGAVGGVPRVVAIVAALLVVSCGTTAGTAPLNFGGPNDTPAATPASRPADATPTAAPSDAMPRYAKLRAFVTAEAANEVWVLDGARGGTFAVVSKIPVGRLPHQIAVSPDGKWVAVNNRLADSTSIIDPATMKEVVRVKVGKQPHGITFSTDSKTLYIAHERDTYILPIEVGTWKQLPPLMVGVPQHVLTVGTKRPNELYFTLTNTNALDHLRVYDLENNAVTNIKVGDVHDAYFTPDQSEVWSSSSGFLEKPSDRMVIYDVESKRVKEEIRFPGRYPFHTLKANQDGMYIAPDQSLMLLSDHIGPGLLWVDWKAREIVGETKLGQQPFHTAYDPLGDRLLTTTNVDGMVNVIDVKTRHVVQKIPVPKAHGIVAVGVP